MPDEPLITIIMPTFNRANFLPEAIESVLAQNYMNYEFLIIDDGSSDNSKAVIEGYRERGNIKYLYQENSGQSVARNKGIANAKGDFICFLDSDNRWLPNKLNATVKAIKENPDADIIYGDVILIDEVGTEFSRSNMPRYSGRITKEILKDNCISMNTTLVRASKLRESGGFSNHVEVADDFDLWLRLSANCTYMYLPMLMAEYRVMKNQISSDKTKRFASNEEIILRFLDEHPNLLSKKDENDALNYFYLRAARHFSGSKHYSLANSYFMKALKTKVLSVRNIRTMTRHILNLIR